MQIEKHTYIHSYNGMFASTIMQNINTCAFACKEGGRGVERGGFTVDIFELESCKREN